MPAISKSCFVAVVAVATTLLAERSSRGDDQSSVISDSKALPAAQLSKLRSPAEMRAAVTDALRASAVAKDPAARDDAGRNLVSTLLDLERDQNLPHDERVQLHAQVRLRLLALEKTLRAEQANQTRNATRKVDPSKSAKDVPAALPQSTTVLAQVAAPAVAGARRGRVARPGVFGAVNNNAVVGQSQTFDYGQDLVDVIHAVVQPPTWDINGGPGSVVYFRTYRVLVVTAPSEVHSEIGDLLGQLRK